MDMMDDDHDPDCPICLDPMSPADLQHPLRCSHQCGYNFCRTCIESLITSSKDDYMEASDGNMHVKVFLHCPNCRSDLGPSIRETLLLRKVRTLEQHCSESNVELTASEKRLKAVMDEEEVQNAILEAQKQEDAFFGQKSERNAGGKRQSFQIQQTKPNAREDVDLTLFQGLDSAMTKKEKLLVTKQMTSGDTGELAAAAEKLQAVADRIRKGLQPPSKQAPNKQAPKQKEVKRSSIFDLIAESKKARSAKAVAVAPNKGRPTLNHMQSSMSSHNGRPTLNRMQSSMSSLIDMEVALDEIRETREYNNFMKHYPLPVRMPRYAEFHPPKERGISFLPPILSLEDSTPLEFCDDTWDGSATDAFSKITVSGSTSHPVVTKKQVKNIGVERILTVAGDDVADRIDEERHRVLVASVSRDAGNQGILKGDVVTHVNGEEFHGTAKDLDTQVKFCVKYKHTFTLVFNAERSVAEALKRRAMAAETFGNRFSDPVESESVNRGCMVCSTPWYVA